MLPELPTLTREASLLRDAINEAYLAEEPATVQSLLQQLPHSEPEGRLIARHSRELIEAIRGEPLHGLDALLQEYNLSNQEGVALMCLAEALLRIPDRDTAEELIKDKLATARWETHLGHGRSLFVNASTWGLMLTGRWVRLDPDIVDDVGSFVSRLVARSGEPAIRMAITAATRILARQFVMGHDMEQAWQRSRSGEYADELFSFDMLGEAALTADDAEHYFQAYRQAIDYIGRHGTDPSNDVFARPGISVKLSALHPRFEFAQRSRVMKELVPRVRELTLRAQDQGLALTIDAEEASRWMLTLDVFEQIYARTPTLQYEGFGIVVQSYQKRATASLHYLLDLARHHGRRIPLRLVKGAYWDSEIKLAQEQGLAEYPVFTRKVYTDVSYLACARLLLENTASVYPQFATHNAHTLAAVHHWAGGRRDYEFQRLHGMGLNLYRCAQQRLGELRCRVYAPVGEHAQLLPYLVRRLLENGANTSFVNRITDAHVEVDDLIADPIARAKQLNGRPHSAIPRPAEMYRPERDNASGINLQDERSLSSLAEAMAGYADHHYRLAGSPSQGKDWHAVVNPANHEDEVGEVAQIGADELDALIDTVQTGFAQWSHTPATRRAEHLEHLGALLEKHRAELMSLIIREGGRGIADALAEVREAVDFCRYYAWRTREGFAEALPLPGPAGERNALHWHGRGVFACISPWNFPVAIFTGQVTAALAAGNTVVAKPAGATPLVALRIIELMREAGIPDTAVQAAIGPGKELGEVLCADPRIAGIAFTGSIDTAQYLHRRLAQRDGPLVPLIAETGGQNAMIVDSSALTEQVVSDVIRSAFNSAGQRCSALRVLYLQEDIAEAVLAMLSGAIAELHVGDPAKLHTDVGPVIDAAAQTKLQGHIDAMKQQGRLIHKTGLSAECDKGSFVAPHVFEIDDIRQLPGEVFGPILHVIRYPAGRLDEVIDAINATGYGLTLGIHSRLERTAEHIRRRARVGNIYVNRNMIGSVVGVQPFGGEGLSGTGPKAGGPHYLHRFATERTVSDNIAAVGGNPALLSLDDKD
jgi:RHH-type proline utilization regulon transcriptional repressor/proline dehydrogenase/delta 1-pyrroline-5-carboxylate dehydrogenase